MNDLFTKAKTWLLTVTPVPNWVGAVVGASCLVLVLSHC